MPTNCVQLFISFEVCFCWAASPRFHCASCPFSLSIYGQFLSPPSLHILHCGMFVVASRAAFRIVTFGRSWRDEWPRFVNAISLFSASLTACRPACRPMRQQPNIKWCAPNWSWQLSIVFSKEGGRMEGLWRGKSLLILRVASEVVVTNTLCLCSLELELELHLLLISCKCCFVTQVYQRTCFAN